MDQSETREWEVLAAKMRRTLAQNLSAALMVAGSTQEGDGITKMNLTDLNHQTDIARSTLSKLANGTTASGIQANPDLETICRLAAALNLPPALLLMSADDWQRLLGALNGLPQAMSGSFLNDLTSRATQGDKVRVGLILAEKLKLYPDKNNFKADEKEIGARQDEIDRDIDSRNEMKRLAILTTTAVVQRALKNPGDLSTLTAIGAIFGSSFNKSI
jgi:transcriptional regulator with XRE-family HTH domain